MESALVIAIVRPLMLEAVEKSLQTIGVRSITVSSTRGFGEQPVAGRSFLSRDRLMDQVQIEVFVARDIVDRVATAIIDAAYTGTPGDGIVAILPVDKVLSVRTRAETIPNRSRLSP